jgi:hypothetical protein
MRAILLSVILTTITVPLAAAPCVSAALTTYTAAGFSCEVGAAVFSNFSFFLQNSGAGGVLDEGDITVSPLVEPSTVGLRFGGDFQATGGPNGPGPAQGIRVNEYRFFFQVTQPGSIFTSIASRLNDPVRIVQNPLKFGDIFASNLATNDGALALVHDDDPGLTEVTMLNSERLTVPADNMIHLAAGASAEGTIAPVGFTSLSSADYLYTYRELEPVVPEPGTWFLSLTGIGISVLFGCKRKARSVDN